ncbi:MAG: hypothetical protein IKW70_05915 [Verrucomicrobia bacterium]|nr:hypothetical protein [Verrucomicrobiota bacterium]
MKKTTLLLAAIFVAAAVSANALTPAQVNAIDEAISGAKLRNVSSVATELLTKANASDREDVLAQVIRATKSTKAGALIQTVKAISESNPELAPLAAAKAADLQKSLAVKLAKVAIKAAPAYASEIVTEVSAVAPKYAAEVEAAVGEIDPSLLPLDPTTLPQVTVNFGQDAFGNPAPGVLLHQVAPVTEGTVPGVRRYPAKFYPQP